MSSLFPPEGEGRDDVPGKGQKRPETQDDGGDQHQYAGISRQKRHGEARQRGKGVRITETRWITGIAALVDRIRVRMK